MKWLHRTLVWVRRVLLAQIGWTLLGIALTVLAQKGWDYWRNRNARVEIAVESILITRQNEGDFPECRIVINFLNTFSEVKTVAFDRISFLHGRIEYSLAGTNRTFILESDSPKQDTLRFATSILDDFLKTPQTPDLAVFELVGKITQTGSQVLIALTDKEVVKATYWQTPVLDEKEIKDLGVIPIEHVWRVWYHIPSGEKGYAENKGTFYVSPIEATELDFADVSKSSYDSTTGKIGFSQRLDRVFKKKYGGFYFGVPEASMERVSAIWEAFPSLSQYDILEMTGLEFERNICNSAEFVHYSFSHPELSQFFETYSKNARYFVVLVHDRGLGQSTKYLTPIADSLNNRGFRVGLEVDSLFYLLFNTVSSLSDSSRIQYSVEWLNEHAPLVDSVIAVNRPLVVWLGDTTSASSKAIYDILSIFYPGDLILNIGIDLRPMIYNNRSSPFSDMVLVFPEFSRQAQSFQYTSYKLENERLIRTRVPVDSLGHADTSS